MDTLDRRITPEDAINRFYENHMPVIEDTINNDTNTWGKYPMDVIITPDDRFYLFNLKNKLPIVYDEKNKTYVFRYSNIIKMRTWLYNYIQNCHFYKLSLRKNQYKWVEVKYDFYADDVYYMYKTFPNIYSFDLCSIICINEDAELFNSYFRLNDYVRYELNFLNFVDYIFNGGDGYNFSVPYFNLPLSITSDVRTVGEYITSNQAWVESKKYYVGDVVVYNDEYYYLKYGDNFNLLQLTGLLYENIKNDIDNQSKAYNVYTTLPTIHEIRNLSNTKMNVYKTYDEFGNEEYAFILPYYTGCFDENSKICNFDTKIGSEKHWFKLFDNEDVYEVSDVLTEGAIDRFISVQRSYDDNNKLLPFIVSNVNGKKVPILKYKLGYRNFIEKENGSVVDFMKKIVIKDSNGKHKDLVYDFYDTSVPNKDIQLDSIPDGYNLMEFTYFIGLTVKKINENFVVEENSGVELTETRRFNRKIAEYTIDKNILSFKTIDLYDVSEETNVNNSTTSLAKTKYSAKNIFSDKIKCFVDDRLFGATMLELNNDEASINRGSYAAFERYNILGEVNSFDDLKNYRNNYFKL